MTTSGEQLELGLFAPPPARFSDDNVDAHSRRIAGFLSISMPDPVDVVLTNNRRTMISCSSRQGRLTIRLHRLFRHADARVLEHLAAYLVRGRNHKSSRILDEFIKKHTDEIARAEPRAVKIVTEGEHYELSEVLTRVNQVYFGGTLDVAITWGRQPARKRAGRRRGGIRSRALATYSYDERLIRVSPILDSRKVPVYVMDWIIYHELLHHVLPVDKSGSRNRYHTESFRRLEMAFIDYDKAKQWETAHRDWLTR